MRDPLAPYLEHTNLCASATEGDIRQLCEEALKHNFAAICVAPYRVSAAASALAASSIRVATVIGFPHGAEQIEIKRLQAARAISDGAKELDMVINIGAARDGNWDVLRREISEMQQLCGRHQVRLKVNLEVALLSEAQKIEAAKICLRSEVDYVQTSTGVTAGPTVQDVRLLREILGDDVGIKACGGIWDRKTALIMIKAGATRVGTSHSVDMVRERFPDLACAS